MAFKNRVQVSPRPMHYYIGVLNFIGKTDIHAQQLFNFDRNFDRQLTLGLDELKSINQKLRKKKIFPEGVKSVVGAHAKSANESQRTFTCSLQVRIKSYSRDEAFNPLCHVEQTPSIIQYVFLHMGLNLEPPSQKNYLDDMVYPPSGYLVWIDEMKNSSTSTEFSMDDPIDW